MLQPQPTLPTRRAFAVLFRAQPSWAPLSWDGRAEYVGLRAVIHFYSLEELLAFMRHVLAGVPVL